MCQSCGRGRETTLGHIRYRDSAEVQVGWCLCSAWSLVGCRGETRVSLLYGVLPVISPRGLTDDASLYLLNPRRLVCRGVVSRDVHTLRHITPRWGWSPGEQTERGNGGGLPGSHQEVSLELARGRFPIPFRRSLLYHWFVAAESRREGSDDMAEQRHNSGIVKAEQPAVQADDDTRRRAARRKTSLPFALPRAS